MQSEKNLLKNEQRNTYLRSMACFLEKHSWKLYGKRKKEKKKKKKTKIRKSILSASEKM